MNLVRSFEIAYLCALMFFFGFLFFPISIFKIYLVLGMIICAICLFALLESEVWLRPWIIFLSILGILISFSYWFLIPIHILSLVLTLFWFQEMLDLKKIKKKFGIMDLSSIADSLRMEGSHMDYEKELLKRKLKSEKMDAKPRKRTI